MLPNFSVLTEIGIGGAEHLHFVSGDCGSNIGVGISTPLFLETHSCRLSDICLHVIAKERHETFIRYKPRERVALEWFIPIIVELLVP